jgi:uncharacterized protein YggE
MKKIFILMFLFPFCLRAEESKLNIKGEARTTVTPDQALFQIHISVLKKTEEDSQTELVKSSNEVLKILKSEGFNDNQIKLTSYSIEEATTWDKNKPVKLGYRASQSFEVKFLLDKNRIVKIYKSLTGSTVENVTIDFETMCSDTLEERIKNDLIVKCLKDARVKSELITKTAGTHVKGIAEISYNVFSAGSGYGGGGLVLSSQVGNTTPMQAMNFSVQDITIEEEIIVTYYLETPTK